jgi:hypothetical protein
MRQTKIGSYFIFFEVNMKKSILFLFVGLALFASCANEDSTNNSASNGDAILLKVGSLATRAATNIQGDEFEKGEQINVFLSEVTDGTPSTRYTQPMVYVTTNNSGNMKPSNSIFPYYPANGNKVDLWAVYPSGVTQNSTVFQVASDQSTTVNYKKSDLMYCVKNNIERQSNVVDITFKHKLAKVIVQLTVPEGKEPTILDNALIKITNVYRKIAIDPKTQYIGTTTDELSEKGSVIMTTNGRLGCAAIVVPQTLEADYFLEIKLSNGDILNYLLPQTINLASGTVNTFTISVNEQSITANYSVAAWDDQEAITSTLSLDD